MIAQPWTQPSSLGRGDAMPARRAGSGAPRLETAGRAAAEPGGRRATALVVDDDLDVCRTLACVLRQAGFRVSTSTNGHDALRRLRDSHPDLLVTDIRMPGVPGTDLCRAVRNTLEISRTKILAITGFHSAHGRWEAFDSGADEYLVKPFTPEEMLTSARRLLHLGRRPRWLEIRSR